MSLYTTPLQFGYFFSLILWLVLLIRGAKENRLSDQMLGWVMFMLAMEMQDYTFGFAGINVLWNELNGFPRSVHLLFGPAVYFYFRSQVNREFRLQKKHLIHLIPYALYFFYELTFFLAGPETVEMKHSSSWDEVMGYVYRVVMYSSYIFYFRKCLLIYRDYKAWSVNQFSNIDLIDFNWFKNFIILMIIWIGFRFVLNILDSVYDWDFYQDWWWNLALVVVATYIGLAGVMQKQPAQIYFEVDEVDLHKPVNKEKESSITDEQKLIAERLNKIMDLDRLYLQSELNLRELAQHLKTNTSLLSKTINQTFGMNFNDYVNSLRIEEFINRYREDEANNYTIISLAFDAGFNSTATFNRAFKKAKGRSPKEYLKNYE